VRHRPREYLWGDTVPPRHRGGPAASYQLNVGVRRQQSLWEWLNPTVPSNRSLARNSVA
jgi:hypothetical protein